MSESNTLTFGIALPQVFFPDSVDVALVSSFVTRAEPLGFESFWVQVQVTEHSLVQLYNFADKAVNIIDNIPQNTGRYGVVHPDTTDPIWGIPVYNSRHHRTCYTQGKLGNPRLEG